MNDPLSPDPALATPEIPKEERGLAMMCHLLSLTGFVIPFGTIIGPLVIWLVKKDESPAVDVAGRESLNFQLTLLIFYVIAFVLLFLAIGVCLLPVIAVLHIVFVIIATIKVNDGVQYRYPMTIRML